MVIPIGCLLIADDLTGGADTGAQFAKVGLRTLLVSLQGDIRVDFSKYRGADVFAINTDSRRLDPEKAYVLLSNLLKDYPRELYPVLFKKVDSTLRGNIGYEIDAILSATDLPLCFVAPSYPEQGRTLLDGIMRIGGEPVSLTEIARDATTPVLESHVPNLLRQQSLYPVGWVDLSCVTSGGGRLREAVENEQQKGRRIIIFDAVNRHDLANIVGAAFSADKVPLLVGSAGLAQEVGQKLAPWSPVRKTLKPVKHVLVVSGSASSVTHRQLTQLGRRDLPIFELDRLTAGDTHPEAQARKKELAMAISSSLWKGHAVLKAPSERLVSMDPKGPLICEQIITALASIALMAMEASKGRANDLGLILTGGDTALGVLNTLGVEELEIKGEILEGIAVGQVMGGPWDGLHLITKAGAFGKEDALDKILNLLETESR